MTSDRELSKDAREFLFSLGASEVGFADLSSVKDGPCEEFDGGISIIAALNPHVVRDVATAPSLRYCEEYQRINYLLNEIGSETVKFLNSRGFRACTIPSTSRNYLPGKFLVAPFSHKKAATIAGLGWIGKNDLLITREYGSAVRLNTVFTAAPLETGDPVQDSSCGNCSKCIEACPAGALKGVNWNTEIGREEIMNIRDCHSKTMEFASLLEIDPLLCGTCISVCPWTRKYIDNSGK
jgi:epoxyqueuosine reductase QueG